MTPWPEITCPNCGSRVEEPDAVTVDCGKVVGECDCPNCGRHFETPQIEYWLWLGVRSAPPE